jgi:N-acetylglucosamine-6-phosphate deacetylase
MKFPDRKHFIDLHTHGIGNYDTRTANPEHILKMAELHWEAGGAAILPTIYPGPIKEMRRNLEAIRKAIEIQRHQSAPAHITRRRSLIPGVHLEGPFLNPVRSGALDKKALLKPSMSSLKKLIRGYEDIVTIITIAPEMPGALRIIEECRRLGIKVNMGHSDATFQQASEGKNAGATGITHIFNAMRPFHHREPGLAGLGLLDEDLYIEVIADGVHLHRKTLELIFSVKRLDRILLVSDSVLGAKRNGRPAYTTDNVLAGSGLLLADCAQLLKKIHIPDAEIIEAGADNPERYIGVSATDL